MGQSPILTSGAAEIATPTSKGKPFAARIEVKDWFLFDGIDGDGRELSIDKSVKDSVFIDPGQTPTPFAFWDDAPSLACMTLDLASR
jgi:hypothetical protein